MDSLVTETVTGPVTEPVAEPVAEPAAEPVAEPQPLRFKSLDENVSSAKYIEVHSATEGVHSQIIVGQGEDQEKGPRNVIVVPPPRRIDSAIVLEDSEGEERAEADEKGQNRDMKDFTVPGGKKEEVAHAYPPLDQPVPFLCVEPGKEEQGEFVVSESPTGTDEGVYEEAYKKEAERIKGEGKVVETNSTADDMGAMEGTGTKWAGTIAGEEKDRR